MADPVITVTPTIMDGTVVRWYRDLRAAELHHDELSASRNGVCVGAAYLTDLPEEWVTAAWAAFAELAADHDADLSRLATHRVRNLGAGPIEAV